MTDLLLGLAALLALACGNGEHANALVAWLAPLLALRFVRTRRGWRGLLAAWCIVAAGWAFAWHAIFRAQGVELLVAALVFGGVNLLPYLADRRLHARLPPFAGTLVFPCAFVALEYALASASPLGAWGMVAYTQAGVAPVAQWAAIGGPWGIGFLIAWTASVANASWAAPRERARWLPAAIALALVLVPALGFGAWRSQQEASARRVRVALLLPPVENNLNYDTARAPAIEAHLRTATLRAAREGARLVAWPEDSFFLPGGEGPAFVQRAQALARESGAYVAAAFAAREQAGGLRYRNRFVLLSPGGEVAWDYAKSHPVPGYEAKNMRPGDGIVAKADTTLGSLAGMICFDADHLSMMRQLRGGSDLLLVPSDDWTAIDALHPAMLRMRAIEQGVAIVRPAINGRSRAFDARGREFAPPPRAASEPWLVDLPLERVPTLYLRIGDAIAWASLAGLLLLSILAYARRRASVLETETA